MNRIVSQISGQTSGKEYWGPRFWYLLHMISYSYPEKPTKRIQDTYYNYFLITCQIIPCDDCRKHFSKSIESKSLRFNLDNKQQVIDWFKSQHNDVNIVNGQRIYQGFEVDALYLNSDFDHKKFIELVNYLLKLVKHGEIAPRLFLEWLLLSMKLFPCEKCRKITDSVLIHYDISKYDWRDYTVLEEWCQILLHNINHN
jgi:hypothetical protein